MIFEIVGGVCLFGAGAALRDFFARRKMDSLRKSFVAHLEGFPKKAEVVIRREAALLLEQISKAA